MTITIDQPRQQQPISFDEFLAKYSGSDRYELIDGERGIRLGTNGLA